MNKYKQLFLSSITVVATFSFSTLSAAGPLHEAARAGDLEAIQELLDAGERVDDSFVSTEHNLSSNEYTPLAAAVSEGQSEAAQLLIENGATIGRMTRDSYTYPLSYAITGGHIQTVKVLLEAGANPNEPPTEFGTLPIQDALNKGFTEIADVLISAGAKVNKDDLNTYLEDVAGEYILKSEEKPRLIATAEYLIKRGASAKKSDALIEASDMGFYEMVEFLISKGAKVNSVDDGDNTPLIAAVGQYCSQFHPIKLSMEPEMVAGRDSALKIINLLLRKGARVNVKDYYDDPLIHTVAACGSVLLAEKILSKGAKINSTNKYGETALDKAIEENNSKMVEYLKSKGAKEGETDW